MGDGGTREGEEEGGREGGGGVETNFTGSRNAEESAICRVDNVMFTAFEEGGEGLGRGGKSLRERRTEEFYTSL